MAIENGHILANAKNDMLRHKFWTSLASEKLKSQTRHKYDTISDYNCLLKEIRMVDKEINMSVPISPRHPTGRGQVNAVYDQSMEQRFSNLEKSLKSELSLIEKRLEDKYESKLDRILQRLESTHTTDSRPSFTPSQDRGQGQGYSGGNHGNRNDLETGQGHSQGSPSNWYDPGRGQGHPLSSQGNGVWSYGGEGHTQAKQRTQSSNRGGHHKGQGRGQYKQANTLN